MEFNAKEFSILFTNNLEIQKLNSDFRNKNKPTDVLSFEGDGDYLGDIVISVEKARVQAKEFSCSLTEEIARLIVHGFLHLSGYDHVKVPRSEAQKMRRAEARIMRKIGDLIFF